MAQSSISHRRTHNLLLISKLLSLRDNASPLTLILDSLEQPAKPLLRECIRRANASKTHTVLLSFETLQAPKGIDTFIQAWQIPPSELSATLSNQIGSAIAASSAKRCVILIDSLHPLCSIKGPSFSLPTFLTGLMMSRSSSPQTQTSIMAVYHTDIPDASPTSPYEPSPFTLLSYIATTLITVHSLPNLLSIRQAESRSLARPTFGLAEEVEGILIGLPSAKSTHSQKSNQPQPPSLTPALSGIILDLEHRRKSGRGVQESYFLPSSPKHLWTPQTQKEHITLLDDHPLFRKPDLTALSSNQDNNDSDLSGLTFDLTLTDRQRREREGVVLPYFDAQKSSGGDGAVVGDGGRILYDMGSEDDFDEEEDEI